MNAHQDNNPKAFSLMSLSLDSPMQGGRGDTYLDDAIKNLCVTSRSRAGVSDTSSSVDKPELVRQGRELAVSVEQNVRKALEAALLVDPKTLTTVDQVQDFISSIATTVSEGLTQPGQSLWRTWETPLTFNQTHPSSIPDELKIFSEGFLGRIKGSNAISMAAWIEREFDGRIHPLGDGCGRVAKILSAWILAWNGVPLPVYGDRALYYQEIAKDVASFETYYRDLISQSPRFPAYIEEFQRKIVAIFTQQNIPMHCWGKGEALSLADLTRELFLGEVQLVQRGGQIFRVLDVVNVDVYHTDINGKKLHLYEEKQILDSNRERRRGREASVAEKVKPGEAIEAAARRAMQEELGMHDGYQITVGDQREIEKESPSYPGLRSVYRIHSFSADIATSGFRSSYTETHNGRVTLFAWREAKSSSD